MRYKIKPSASASYVNGVEKTTSGFLWFPTRIDNEIRWLEHAHIKKRFSLVLGWVSMKFIDSNEKEDTKGN